MQPEIRPATRFAPSPSGHLHLGHAHSALFAAREAAEIGGVFLLRIEDIDTGRCRPEFVDGILEDLAWLGLDWAQPVLRQSDRFPLYDKFLHVLEEGGLTYPCFCTRKEIQAEIDAAPRAPHGPDGPLYPGICKHLDPVEARDRVAAGEAHAIRIHMDRAARMSGPLSFVDTDRGRIAVHPESCGDVVLGRKDVPTSYHLAVTVDDALQHVSRVTRGEDLLHATHVHRVLQTLLGFPEPEYRHHGLLTDEQGRRFAKRDRSLTLQAMRQSGLSASEVRARAGFPD
ncbi:MAG: tRNA glutamyl-Q(34) synthetase GluQRS [Alphaproteobacteria bacterium]